MHRLLAKKSLPVFTYRDYGSLISLGNYEAVGNLMGRMVGRSVKIQGFLARMLYLSRIETIKWPCMDFSEWRLMRWSIGLDITLSRE